jgi:hypothetical protein
MTATRSSSVPDAGRPPAVPFIAPAACLGVVGVYALYDLRARPRVIGGEIARPVVPSVAPGPPAVRHERPSPRPRRSSSRSR